MLVNIDRIGNTQEMLEAAQIRAARALLGWRQEDLARASKVGLATIARIEQGEGMVQGNFSTIMKIQQALECAGINFVAVQNEMIGVQLRRRRKPASKST